MTNETKLRSPEIAGQKPSAGLTSTDETMNAETMLEPAGEPDTGPPPEPGPKSRAGNDTQEDRIRAKDTNGARKKARTGSRIKDKTDTSRARAKDRAKVEPQNEIDRVQTGVRARTCEKESQSRILNRDRNHAKERAGTDNALGVTTEHETWGATPPFTHKNNSVTFQDNNIAETIECE